MIFDIDNLAIDEDAFRRVIYTDDLMQIVLMFLRRGEEIGLEKHENTSQFIKVVAGRGVAIIGENEYDLLPGMAVVIPPYTEHNIYAHEYLSLYTIYSGEILHEFDEVEFH